MSETLNVPISEKTRRKLGALAILTGKKFDSMEAELAVLLDGVLSIKIDEAMADIDGRELPEVDSPPSQNSRLVRVNRNVATGDFISQNDILEDLSGHSLSGDADEGAPSLEEQYEQEEQNLRKAPAVEARRPLTQRVQPDTFKLPPLEVEDAGDDVEKFLEELGEKPKKNPLRAASVQQRRATAPAHSDKPRVKVSDYDGNEDGDLF